MEASISFYPEPWFRLVLGLGLGLGLRSGLGLGLGSHKSDFIHINRGVHHDRVRVGVRVGAHIG